MLLTFRSQCPGSWGANTASTTSGGASTITCPSPRFPLLCQLGFIAILLQVLQLRLLLLLVWCLCRHRLLLIHSSSGCCYLSRLVSSQAVRPSPRAPPAASTATGRWPGKPRDAKPATAAAAARTSAWPGPLLLLQPAAAAAAALAVICHAYAAACCHARVGVCLTVGAAHWRVLHGADTALACVCVQLKRNCLSFVCAVLGRNGSNVNMLVLVLLPSRPVCPELELQAGEQ
jgi:hypothetical protein